MPETHEHIQSPEILAEQMQVEWRLSHKDYIREDRMQRLSKNLKKLFSAEKLLGSVYGAITEDRRVFLGDRELSYNTQIERIRHIPFSISKKTVEGRPPVTNRNDLQMMISAPDTMINSILGTNFSSSEIDTFVKKIFTRSADKILEELHKPE